MNEFGPPVPLNGCYEFVFELNGHPKICCSCRSYKFHCLIRAITAGLRAE